MLNVFRRIFQIKKVMVYCIKTDELHDINTKIQCSVLPININICDRVLEMRDEEVLDSFINMLNSHQIGVFGESDGKIVSHAWMQIYEDKQNNYNESLGYIKENEAVIHYCNTVPHYRGNNIYPFLVSNLASTFFKANKNGVLYITTDVDNISSQNGLTKIGFRFFGKRILFKIAKFIKFSIKYKDN